MLKHELEELIRNGENSGIEFKRDNVSPDSLAKEIAAWAYARKSSPVCLPTTAPSLT